MYQQDLRILNVNCRSVTENNSEFKDALENIKPDIICGLEGKNQGNNMTKMLSTILKYFQTVLTSSEKIGVLEAGELLLLFDLISRLSNVLTLLRIVN